MDKKVWQWQRSVDSQQFLLSTSRELLQIAFVQRAFATEAMFWTQALSEEATRAMLDTSLTLGLYKVSQSGEHEAVGMARMVTDYTTLAYLTDVYLEDAYRNLGLGKWMIQSCRDVVLEMKDLRFLILLTGSEQAQKLYRREFGMKVLDGRDHALTCMGARRGNLADAAAADKTT